MGSGSLTNGTGQVLKARPGAELSDGDTFTVDTHVFTFRKSAGSDPADVLINNGMTSEDVARAIAAALDRVFLVTGGVDDPAIFTVGKVVQDEVRIFGHPLGDTGPLLSFTGQNTGDNHGSLTSSARDRDGGMFSGVYIDDFVVGFASRGEMVTGALPSSTDFTDNPAAVGSQQQILTGAYQLQVRPAEEYASIDNGLLTLDQTFNVNDRFANAITLVAQAASQIPAHATFTIDDGAQALVFEFSFNGLQTVTGSVLINVQPTDTAATVAGKIRDAINLAVGDHGFKVRAATYPGGNRVDLFDALEAFGSGLDEIKTFHSIGDQRPVDAPGQTIIQNSTVSYSRQVGIQVIPLIGQIRETGVAFTQLSTFPMGTPGRNGAVGVLPVLNNQGWMPGVTVKNNVVVHSGRTAIQVGGDPNTSYAYEQAGNKDANLFRDSVLFVPFVRVLNNTIYDARLGIASVNTASPSILNNIIADVSIVTNNVIRFAGGAVYLDAASGSTVVGANVFQNNVTNGTLGSFAIALVPGDDLFVDADKNNFYLKPSSLAIDSSLDSLQDRNELTAVTGALLFPPSPIQAPITDLLGQKRVDDPNVSSPVGLGGEVFKDRGAVERADFAGPTATLSGPLDNDATGNDRSPLANQVLLVNQLVTEFAVQLLDTDGSGIDGTTVGLSKFTIQRTANGTTETLTPGVDFVLAYDNNSKIARLLPADGLWINGTYTILVANSGTAAIKDLANNELQPNYFPVGLEPQTRFVVQLTDSIASPWQNPTNPYDVNADGRVSGQDVLWLVNAILTGQSGPLPLVAVAPPYYDVNGDGRCGPPTSWGS